MKDRNRFKKLIDRYKDQFSECSIFGIPISKLKDNELRACICLLGEQEKQNRENRSKERESMFRFRQKLFVTDELFEDYKLMGLILEHE